MRFACQHNINIESYYAKVSSEQDYVVMLIIGVVFYLKQRDASYKAFIYFKRKCILVRVTGNIPCPEHCYLILCIISHAPISPKPLHSGELKSRSVHLVKLCGNYKMDESFM